MGGWEEIQESVRKEEEVGGWENIPNGDVLLDDSHITAESCVVHTHQPISEEVLGWGGEGHDGGEEGAGHGVPFWVGWVGGWVGGWMGWVEEEMNQSRRSLAGVGRATREEKRGRATVYLFWVGGWVGWVEVEKAVRRD